VFEGEKPFACENKMLGMFQLPNIRQGPAGSANIMVTLHVAEDGILHATAYDEDTGEQFSCFFQPAPTMWPPGVQDIVS
jgi:molecular chaperone DnaK